MQSHLSGLAIPIDIFFRRVASRETTLGNLSDLVVHVDELFLGLQEAELLLHHRIHCHFCKLIPLIGSESIKDEIVCVPLQRLSHEALEGLGVIVLDGKAFIWISDDFDTAREDGVVGEVPKDLGTDGLEGFGVEDLCHGEI